MESTGSTGTSVDALLAESFRSPVIDHDLLIYLRLFTEYLKDCPDASPTDIAAGFSDLLLAEGHPVPRDIFTQIYDLACKQAAAGYPVLAASHAKQPVVYIVHHIPDEWEYPEDDDDEDEDDEGGYYYGQ